SVAAGGDRPRARVARIRRSRTRRPRSRFADAGTPDSQRRGIAPRSDWFIETRAETEMGRYYEDFTVGDTYKHWPGRTITAADNTWFTLLTMNQHPIHFDEAYAARSEFRKPLVNSAFTL